MGLSSRAEVEAAVVGVVKDTISEWDIDLPHGVGMDTLLMQDLAFESIDIVQFAVAIEQTTGRRGLPFEKLFMKEDNYVDDLELREVADFLCEELGIRQ